MKTILALILGSVLLVAAGVRVSADDSERLQGKWSSTKTNEYNQVYTQTLEINKDKFTYKRASDGGGVSLCAEGTVKLEKLGPFAVVRFTNIRGGYSETDLSEINEDYVAVYQLGYNTWIVAMNFDKERDEQGSADVYRRATANKAK
jgi:hypothetical protein